MKKLLIIAFVSGLVGFTKAANTCWSTEFGYPCCEITCNPVTSDGMCNLLINYLLLYY